MTVLIILLIAAGIAIFFLYKKMQSQLVTIQSKENEINNLKESMETTKTKMAADHKRALELKAAEYQAELDSRISEIEEDHARELEKVQCRIEAKREELYEKEEKDLLVDIVLGLGALSKGQEAISTRVLHNQENVNSIKENLFTIGDSVLSDISKGHAETIEKLGVHGDMTVASILADIAELMSKR